MTQHTDHLRERYRALVHTASNPTEAAELLNAALELGKAGFILNADQSDWIKFEPEPAPAFVELSADMGLIEALAHKEVGTLIMRAGYTNKTAWRVKGADLERLLQVLQNETPVWSFQNPTIIVSSGPGFIKIDFIATGPNTEHHSVRLNDTGIAALIEMIQSVLEPLPVQVDDKPEELVYIIEWLFNGDQELFTRDDWFSGGSPYRTLDGAKDSVPKAIGWIESEYNTRRCWTSEDPYGKTWRITELGILP